MLLPFRGWEGELYRAGGAQSSFRGRDECGHLKNGKGASVISRETKGSFFLSVEVWKKNSSIRMATICRLPYA